MDNELARPGVIKEELGKGQVVEFDFAMLTQEYGGQRRKNYVCIRWQ